MKTQAAYFVPVGWGGEGVREEESFSTRLCHLPPFPLNFASV